MKINLDVIRYAKVLYSSSKGMTSWIKRITGSNIYISLVKRQIRHQAAKDKNGPFNLVVELTNLCNARCVMCPHQSMLRRLRVMNSKTFKLLVDHLKKNELKFNKIMVSGMGEPFTDRQLIYRLKILKKFGIPIRLYTNASLLTEKSAKELVSIGLDEINLSFNGATPDTYHQIMGLDYAKTNMNIMNLLKIKKRSSSQLPKIQISLVITKENEKEVKNYLNKWGDKVNLVTVSKAHQWGGGVQVQSGFNNKKPNLVFPCRSLWHTLNIDSAGYFVICCRDYESRIILGNLKDNSFTEILNHPRRQEYKKNHLYYSDKKLPAMCQKCNFPYQDGIEWFIPRSYD